MGIQQYWIKAYDTTASKTTKVYLNLKNIYILFMKTH